jgi:Protein of unknown function (DUF2959)
LSRYNQFEISIQRASNPLYNEFVSTKPFYLAVSLCVLLVSLAGCTRAYYKTMSTLGKQKRDILISRVKDARKDQQETKEQIKTTMESFQALTGFQGGSLEKSYKRLNSEYEKANDQAVKLHNRIDSIDQVSNDMFNEWQGEIKQMGDTKLRAQSTQMLRASRLKEAAYLRSMHRTEEKMTPVLKSFHDQVLFLKHNLNARAIGSLKVTTVNIQGDVADLTASIDASMVEADSLIQSLSTPNN